jgi:hypothetical protein
MQKFVDNSRLRRNSILKKKKGDQEAKGIKFGHLLSGTSTGPRVEKFPSIFGA